MLLVVQVLDLEVWVRQPGVMHHNAPASMNSAVESEAKLRQERNVYSK